MLAENKLNKLLLSCSSEVLKAYNDLISTLVYSSASSLMWSPEPVNIFTIDQKCKPSDREKIAKSLEQYRQTLMSIIQRGITLAVIQSANVQQQALAGFTRMDGKEVDVWRDEAANAFIQGRMNRFGGLNLSDRVWNYTQQTKAEFELAMSQALEQGIASGMDAETLGRKVRRYLNNPDMMYRRYHLKKVMSDGTKKDVVEWRRRVIDENGKVHFVKEDLANVGTGVYRSARQNALRLTITETNMAYNYANCKRWSEEPFVLGIRIRLSGNHPEKDICDELQGDYPADFDFPGWHPRCRCTMSSILIDRKSEEWKHLRSLPADEYAKYKSPNRIKEYPDAFKKWCEDNKKKLTKAREEKKLPYFVRNNEKAVGEIVGWNEEKSNPQSAITPDRRTQILKAAEKQQMMRSYEEQMDILARWDARKYPIAFRDNFKQIEKEMGIKRQRSMSFDLANTGRGNKFYGTNKAFGVNCQSSVVAHEMRRRGFDVTAQPNWKDGGMPEQLSQNVCLCWRKLNGDAVKYPLPIGYDFDIKTKEWILMKPKELIKAIDWATREEGRYNVWWGWKDSNTGHIVTFERLPNGKGRWYDPQTGNIDFMDESYANRIYGVHALRVDDKILAPEWAKGITFPYNGKYNQPLRTTTKLSDSLGFEGHPNPKYIAKARELIKGSGIKIHPSRLENAVKSKNEFYKFEKEYNMCKVAVQNGHKVEMLEEVSGVSGCDVLFDGKYAELKSITSVSNVEHRFNHAKEQGAEVVLFELQTKNEKIVQKINELKGKGLKGYYYIRGENILIEI